METPLTDTALPRGTHGARHNSKDKNAYALAETSFESSRIPLIDKLESFPRFATKRSLARFLVKHEIFKKILHTPGVIVECGVFNGAGLFTWAQLSNIYEPVNYTRKVVGFDTFSGFPDVNRKIDNAGNAKSKAGDLKGAGLGELQQSVQKLNEERHLSHIETVQLVPGDFLETGPAYIKANPHTVVSLLYLDFDLFEPTKAALTLLVPRMPKGAIIAFDELNCESFPGETQAVLETIGLGAHQMGRFPIDPWITYMQL